MTGMTKSRYDRYNEIKIYIPEVQTVVSLMRGQSATWTDRRIRPTVHERNITAGQLVPLDVCHAFLARRSTS